MTVDTVPEILEAPRILTPLPGPKARALIERDMRALSPSYLRPYPLVAARGRAAVIEDVDGNRFLDFTAGIAVAATGHCHPDVVEAIHDQASRLVHMSGTDFYYEPQIDLAEKLASLAGGLSARFAQQGPGGGWKVFFTNSGTEAVEAALKLARFHTRRWRFVAFHGAFHGRTYGALSVGASKPVHRRGFGPLLPGVHHLPYGCSEEIVEELFQHVAPPEEVAAIVVEPVLGEGGYVIPPREFLPSLRRLCDRYGILLIADEVQAGMGRTGKMFACEHFGVVPDIICLAKGIASGMPLGAMVARTSIMTWPGGSHASTFGGNPVACRAALVTIDLLERQYLRNASERGQQLRSGLEQLAETADWLVHPRGLGLMVACDVRQGGRPAPKRRDALLQAAFERGLLLLGCGPTAIRFSPPLCVTAEQVDAALAVLESAVQTVD